MRESYLSLFRAQAIGKQCFEDAEPIKNAVERQLVRALSLLSQFLITAWTKLESDNQKGQNTFCASVLSKISGILTYVLLPLGASISELGRSLAMFSVRGLS